MKIIAKFAGGSKAYGLYINPEQSDLDLRWVFLHTEISKIIGLNRHDRDCQKTLETDDNFGYELRFFLNLLKKGNTQTLELLFNENWLEITPEFNFIQENKYSLISSENLFKVLLGYLNGEKHIITGTNAKGNLGAKRREQLEKYGYSFRNCVHALRLARIGILFFRDNIYPVNIVEQDKEYGQFIRDVKINPQKHKSADLINLIEKFENELKNHFNLRSQDYKFDDKVANDICYALYMPILDKSKSS